MKNRRGAHLVPKKTMFVYFVQCGHERGPIKIGYADNVATRLSKLQNGCPYPLSLLAAFATEHPQADEHALHGRFARQRMRGEWFEWSAELSAVIAAIQETNHAAFVKAMEPLGKLISMAPDAPAPPKLKIVK